MKNDQKNPIYPVALFSCKLKQVKPADEVKSIKWSLNLNLGFKPTSFKLLLVALAQNTSMLPCHDHASQCCIALIVFPLCCR